MDYTCVKICSKDHFLGSYNHINFDRAHTPRPSP